MTEYQKKALIEVQRYSVYEGWIVADEGGRLVTYEAFLSLAQRAEAAEAKLAELANQPPVAYTDAEEMDTMQKGTYADMFKPCDEYKSDHKWIPLFTRSAPAADLAELVEDEATLTAGVNALVDFLEDCGDAEQGLRLALRAILSHIDEA